MSAKFYICEHCGNLVGMIHDSGVPMMCCGQKMTALLPNTVEASGEKHLPAVTVEDGAIHVNVGSVDHPMLPEHFIEWVYVIPPAYRDRAEVSAPASYSMVLLICLKGGNGVQN